MKKLLICVAALTSLATIGNGAVYAADAYPIKPIRLLVGFAAGGLQP